MSKEQGWVKLHRSIQDNWVWNDKPFTKGQAFIDLLLLANHSDKKVPLGNELINVEQGSFITSELKLMERWGWSKTKVRAFLKLLENDSMIVKKTDRKKTTIFIVNWGNFQNQQTTEEPQKDHEKTTKEPQKDTNKNDKNEKNVKNNKNNGRKAFIPPTVAEVEAYCIERGNGIDPELFVAHYEARGWMLGKEKMKDWKAAVRTWEGNQKKWSVNDGKQGNEQKAEQRYSEMF